MKYKYTIYIYIMHHSQNLHLRRTLTVHRKYVQRNMAIILVGN